MSSARRLALALLAAASLALSAGDARAQEPTAEQLFDQGLKAMEKRDWGTACPTLRRSWERSNGRAKGALYHLARCEDESRAGRLATSLGLWREVVPLFSDQADITTEAEGRIRALEGKVARLQVRRAAGSPAEMKADLDGVPIAFDERIAVDAGRRTVRASADGYAGSQQVVELANGDQRTIDVDPGKRGEVTTTVVPVAPSGGDAPSGPAPEESDGGSGFTTAGFIAGGVGIGGLLVFAISSPIIAGAEDDVAAACDENRQNCTPEAAEAAERGEAWLVPNAVGLVTGIVGVGLGVTFLVIGASADDGPQVAVRGDRVELSGSF